MRQLSDRGVQVVALARDAPRARQRLPMSNVDVIQGDLYQYASLPGALERCDAVICAAGFSSMQDPLGPFKVDFAVRVPFCMLWRLLRRPAIRCRRGASSQPVAVTFSGNCSRCSWRIVR